MTEARVPYTVGEDWIETEAYDLGERPPRSTDVTTHAYPGFPTDLQAQWMALMTRAEGLSIITERIFSDRWMHVPELERLGAQLRRQNTAVVVRGTRELSGAPVMASDLRASAALVMAGLVARGTTEVHRVYHIDRGYEAIEERCRASAPRSAARRRIRGPGLPEGPGSPTPAASGAPARRTRAVPDEPGSGVRRRRRGSVRVDRNGAPVPRPTNAHATDLHPHRCRRGPGWH